MEIYFELISILIFSYIRWSISDKNFQINQTEQPEPLNDLLNLFH